MVLSMTFPGAAEPAVRGGIKGLKQGYSITY